MHICPKFLVPCMIVIGVIRFIVGFPQESIHASCSLWGAFIHVQEENMGVYLTKYFLKS